MVVPAGYSQYLGEIFASIQDVDGWLAPREIEFLATLAAFPTAEGEILELGSFRGKSTIVLAKAVQLSDRARVTTVDPIPPERLLQNLRRAGVRQAVDVKTMRSEELLSNWQRPIRLLWHDGVNRYEPACRDVAAVMPFFSDRAIIAFHDVLNTSGERIRVYLDQVLGNPHFAAAGVCGSIGWAQYRQDPAAAEPYRGTKSVLARKLRRLVPFQTGRSRPPAWQRLQYKAWRTLVPHHRLAPQQWLARVA